MNPAVMVVVAVMALPVSLHGDLGGYLERSAGAEYSGEQLVSCDTPDGSRDSLLQITQVEGKVMARTDDSAAPIVTAAFGMSATVTDTDVKAVSVEGSDTDGDEDSYTVGRVSSTRFLGRNADKVEVLRNDVKRVEMTIDAATGAVVRSKSFNADGSLYCDRRMVDFVEGASLAPVNVAADDTERLVPLDEKPPGLPETISGFVLADTYPLEEGTMSYYSDGFFSFGVVMTERSIGFDSGVDVVEVPGGKGDYERAFEAGRVTVAWENSDGHLALIGDLPPDLLEPVLAALPGPSTPGFFDRIWARLFG